MLAFCLSVALASFLIIQSGTSPDLKWRLRNCAIPAVLIIIISAITGTPNVLTCFRNFSKWATSNTGVVKKYPVPILVISSISFISISGTFFPHPDSTPEPNVKSALEGSSLPSIVCPSRICSRTEASFPESTWKNIISWRLSPVIR